MNVDFNNTRKQAIYAYDQLARKLNSCIVREDEDGLKDHVVILADELEQTMERLRTCIGTIAMSHEEGNDEFKDVFTEVFPISMGEPCMVIFNPEKEEAE